MKAKEYLANVSQLPVLAGIATETEVLSGATEPAIESSMFDLRANPWTVREADFPITGSPTEQLQFLLSYAVLAPSEYNTQPWLFKVPKQARFSTIKDVKSYSPACLPEAASAVGVIPSLYRGVMNHACTELKREKGGRPQKSTSFTSIPFHPSRVVSHS